MKSFAAQMADLADKTLAQIEAVTGAASQELLEIAQTPVAQGGRMPVDDGFLRGSLATGLNGTLGKPDVNSYELTIAGFELGDTIEAVWTAEYARARHYKPEDFGQGGGMWRDAAAAQWQDLINKHAARLK
ncbi:hypothetical protein [Pseudogemmobacter faecipullorum]|uniref:HK97 gp10 family phage protein n=1 Tax=Pseudogemmobacter faecipullorum TaxID=2755041 RepID=A0ABS8CQX7_9RHOB|nr:hypothetical protein [Pseudogemmobacter faecipullorum]MCB5411781.1 HK97 gp10 family phage protein [Pseudogemmobacter faecipullorum]